MARTTMEEQPEFLVFPPDTLLLLKVLEANTEMVQSRDGTRDWEKCKFKFKILQVLAVGDQSPVDAWDEMVGKEIYGSVAWRLTNSPENKLRIWSEALLQVEMGLGFDLDTNMFPGRTVKGVTSQYNGKATNPQTGQPFKRHQIETLISAGGSALPPQGQGGWGAPQQAQQGWGAPQQQAQQQQAQQQWAQPQSGGWATPGVPQQPPVQQQQPVAQQPQPVAQQAPLQPNATQQWAPQQNLQQQGQEQYAQQPAQQQVQQQPAQQQSFAQQQVAAYTQPPVEDPWAPPPVDPNEPDF